MNRWAMRNPEAYERGERVEDKSIQVGDDLRKYHPRRPCAHCGDPCRGHWCSESCRRAEDGPTPDEVGE